MGVLSSDGEKSVIILPILTVLSTVFFGLRLWTRKVKHAIAIDDWLLCFALFMLYVEDAGAFLLAVKGGEGKPISTLTPDEMTWLFKMFYWPELGYTILVATIKFSILISLHRIFGLIKWFRVAVYILATLEGIWFFGVFFSVLFQCTPIDKAWIPTKPGHCIELLPFLWGNSVSNNIIDWLILLLPVIPVLKLSLDNVHKCLVLGSFALGSVACIASAVRAAKTGTVDVNDLSRSVFQASIWTYIEPSMAIISASLPFLAKMFGEKVLRAFQGITNVSTESQRRQKAQKEPEHFVYQIKPSRQSRPNMDDIDLLEVEMLEEGFVAAAPMDRISNAGSAKAHDMV